MRKQDLGFDYHRYHRLLIEADDEDKRLALIELLIQEKAQDRLAAFAFTVRRDNRDYAGRLSLDEAARIIVSAVGGRGTGRDYLASTVRHLEELGIADDPLHRLEALVRALAGTA